MDKMIDIDRLTVWRADQAPPGTLLLNDTMDGGSMLTFVDPREGELLRPYLLDLSSPEGRAFTALGAVPGSGSWMAVSGWRLVVDVDSAYLSTNGFAAPGDAFIVNGHPGIVGRMRGDLFILLSGEMLPGDPEWSTYVGFSRWQIVIDQPAAGVVMPLVERRPPQAKPQ